MSYSIATLGDVCDITMGQAPDGSTYNESGDGLPLIAGAGDFGEAHPAPKKYTSARGVRVTRPGDIVLSIRASIGQKVLANGDYCLGRGVAGLRSRAELADRYLWHVLDHVGPALRGRARGATFLQVNRADIADVEIPLPAIEEQRRIAAVLDAADALRAKRRQAIAKLDTLTQSIFLDMFGDSSRSLPEVAIADLAARTTGAIRTGPFGSQLLHEEFTDAGVAVLGIDNVVQNRFVWAQRRYITDEKYEQLRRYTVHPGDVLVTIMGTCGRVAVVPGDIPRAINTKHLCCITLDQDVCLPDYLAGCLQYHPGVLRQLGATRGAVMPGLNMGIIKAAAVPLPDIHVQRQFVERKNVVERLARQVEVDASHLDTLFASLQQRAFRGEL